MVEIANSRDRSSCDMANIINLISTQHIHVLFSNCYTTPAETKCCVLEQDTLSAAKYWSPPD